MAIEKSDYDALFAKVDPQLSKLDQALEGQAADIVLRVRDYARTFDRPMGAAESALVLAVGTVRRCCQ